MILEVKDLTVRLGGKNVVDGASFWVEEGSFVSIVGESGAGKTQAALSLCRLVPGAVLQGEILFGPVAARADLARLSEHELRRIRGSGIAYVFQDPASSLNPVLRCGEQVEEVFVAHGARRSAGTRKAALDALASLRLDAARVYRAYPHELSGGMRQRVLLAAALAASPRLLVADEPTTALDVATEADILDLLSDLQRERRLSVLFITHDLVLARKHSATVWVMEKGKVVERLTRDNGFSAVTPYARTLLKANLLDAAPKTPIAL
jgi:ABC-type dipeptide/oligopeptide/nickel transport system ATPase component